LPAPQLILLPYVSHKVHRDVQDPQHVDCVVSVLRNPEQDDVASAATDMQRVNSQADLIPLSHPADGRTALQPSDRTRQQGPALGSLRSSDLLAVQRTISSWSASAACDSRSDQRWRVTSPVGR
jgi:hypothetical protein